MTKASNCYEHNARCRPIRLQRRVLYCCIIVFTVGVSVMVKDYFVGPDAILVGRNASIEFDAHLELAAASMGLRIFTPSNPYYIRERHSWVFWHGQGWSFRYPWGDPGPGDKRTVVRTSFLLYSKLIQGGKPSEYSYTITVPWFLPVTTTGAVLGILWCIRRRRQRLRAGATSFPIKACNQ